MDVVIENEKNKKDKLPWHKMSIFLCMSHNSSDCVSRDSIFISPCENMKALNIFYFISTKQRSFGNHWNVWERKKSLVSNYQSQTFEKHRTASSITSTQHKKIELKIIFFYWNNFRWTVLLFQDKITTEKSFSIRNNGFVYGRDFFYRSLGLSTDDSMNKYCSIK
jgi:hypothetical protein